MAVAENKLIVAEDGLRQEVIQLLEQNDLPVSDIDGDKILFALLQDGQIVGTAGVEYFDDCALIRSISVKLDHRGTGLGKFIREQLEKNCIQHGIRCLYLLTTTAKDFFFKEGYDVIDRERVPGIIKNSSQFSSVCPSSAVVMKKILS
jgi:amino-acid N-acetyltransferase